MDTDNKAGSQPVVLRVRIYGSPLLPEKKNKLIKKNIPIPQILRYKSHNYEIKL